MALVGLMLGRRPSDPQMVLGQLTPDWVLVWDRGLQWGSADVAVCRAQGIRRLLVPEGVCMDKAACAAARTLKGEGRPYVDVVCVRKSGRIFPMLRAVLIERCRADRCGMETLTRSHGHADDVRMAMQHSGNPKSKAKSYRHSLGSESLFKVMYALCMY